MSKLSGTGRFAASLILFSGVLLTASARADGMGGEYFMEADTNHDGALTKEEMSAWRMNRLGAADTDKDGFISATELSEHHAAMMKANQDKHFARFLERFDANKDGKVSLDEIKAFEPPFFDKADTNHDGKISAEEMKAAHPMMPGGKGGHQMKPGDKSEHMKDGKKT